MAQEVFFGLNLHFCAFTRIDVLMGIEHLKVQAELSQKELAMEKGQLADSQAQLNTAKDEDAKLKTQVQDMMRARGLRHGGNTGNCSFSV